MLELISNYFSSFREDFSSCKWTFRLSLPPHINTNTDFSLGKRKKKKYIAGCNLNDVMLTNLPRPWKAKPIPRHFCEVRPSPSVFGFNNATRQSRTSSAFKSHAPEVEFSDFYLQFITRDRPKTGASHEEFDWYDNKTFDKRWEANDVVGTSRCGIINSRSRADYAHWQLSDFSLDRQTKNVYVRLSSAGA